jgi:hypothetical protein
MWYFARVFRHLALARVATVSHVSPRTSSTPVNADALIQAKRRAKEKNLMADNRISASLSTADRQAVLDAINTIRQKLPFLVDLSPEERHTLPKMGDASQAFVAQAIQVAEQNADILPRSFDVEEMRKDVDLLNALSPVRNALAQLSELVEDSYMATGSEAYTAALLVYQYARSAGKGAALDGALDALGQRFARKSRTDSTVKTTPAKP